MLKKKVLAFMASVIMVFNLLPLPLIGAAINIKLGDYVQMGTYYGKPILWRCVAFEKIKGYDDNGNPIIDSTDTVTEYKEGYLPLMLSDKILCIKPFDANGSNISGSHGRGYSQGYYRQRYGSDYWADSNMRCWLNSTASAGNVVWTCGNPPDEAHVWNGYNEYADEAGFLTNFTQSERNAMKSVTQKSLLNGYEYSTGYSNIINSDYHRYDSSISNVVRNYATAFSESVTDTVFLLDVKQINEVYNNNGILGTNYYIGKPTEECVNNSEYKTSSSAVDKKWYTWLRSSGADDYSGNVRDVSSGGIVRSDGAYYANIVGVRPAFFLNPSSARVTSGEGTSGEPYIVEGDAECLTSIELIDCVYDNNTLNVDVRINNNKQDGVLIVAVYDNEEKLARMEQIPVLNNQEQYSVKLNADDFYKDYHVQVMLWDNLEDINYLADAVDTDIG